MAKKVVKRASSARLPKRQKRKKRLKKRGKIKKVSKPLNKEGIFDFQPRKIKIQVVGIGGGGSSIISGIAPKLKKIKFLAANTDSQALKKTAKGVEKFQFGQNLTQGLGTGMNPREAEKAAVAEVDNIKKIFQGQGFSILISCLGGGTGSGASHIFAKAAKDLKNHTLGIFTLPFLFEGEKRQMLAREAMEKIKPNLNAIIIFPNERIFQAISQKTPIKTAFSTINQVLAKNLEGLIEMLYLVGLINIDFADLRAVLSGSGRLSYLNTVLIQGENRAEEAAKLILENPFYEYKITGADRILFNISGGKDLKITEVEKISKVISDSNRKAKIIFGISENEKYKGKIKITLLAVGCEEKPGILDRVKNTSTKTKAKKKIFKTRKIIKVITKSKKNKRKPKKNTKKKIKVKIKSSKKDLVEQPTRENKIEMNSRRNALDIKKEMERAQKEHLSREDEWDIPAFLRREKK